ncbi:hypothetical protein [Pelagicoccus sp. SDUM812003]|uniref:hypothetical protein n=1 Tax=Pelagicoccus sp. SDUM812003 TaxID=3041267 RepID=UPI0028107ED7|nr:hypothetical protein [Pelagicoccus sp. SDUM812003]MDQ8205810.1 hypothetical protein [Pelagicoccus sp. SDUM812003]
MKPRILPLLASIPLVGYFIILCFAFVAMTQIGHWPYYSHPDPKELGMPIWLGASAVGFLASALGAILIPAILGIASLVQWKQNKEKKEFTLVLAFSIYVVGMALWIGDFSMGAFSSWILD